MIVAAGRERDKLPSGMKELWGDNENALFLDFYGSYMTIRSSCQNSHCPFKMCKFYYIYVTKASILGYRNKALLCFKFNFHVLILSSTCYLAN